MPSFFHLSSLMAKLWPSHCFSLGFVFGFANTRHLERVSLRSSLSLYYVVCLEGSVWAITLGSHEIPHLVKDRVYDPTPSFFLTSSLPPPSEKVKLKATSMMAKAQVWNVSIVCAEFKNNISRRVQSLQVAPLGLLLFQRRDIYPRKRGKWRGNRVHMLWKYAGRDWRKNNILPQVAALFLNFFFFLQIRTSHFLCSFKHLLWFPDSWLERIEIWLEKWAMGHVIFKREVKNSHNGQNSQVWGLVGFCFRKSVVGILIYNFSLKLLIKNNYRISSSLPSGWFIIASSISCGVAACPFTLSGVWEENVQLHKRVYWGFLEVFCWVF